MKRIGSMLLAAAMMLTCFLIPPKAEAAMILYYDGANHTYTDSIFGLYVNGKEIHAAIEPIIFNDHALVPVREVFEECGATVDYTAETQCVEIQHDSDYIRLYINDNCAYVNGKRTLIPDGVVPKLINKPGDVTKTMVPVRFVGETAGMDVEFDSATEAIYLESQDAPTAEPTEEPTPEPTEEPTEEPTQEPEAEKIDITRIDSTMVSDTEMKVTVTCDGEVDGKFESFTLDNPERLVVDFYGMDYSGKSVKAASNSSGINAIRTGKTDARVRVVIDADKIVSYSVKQSAPCVVAISIEGEPAATATPAPTAKPSSQSSEIDYADGIPEATAADAGKVIMLDAGHGGSDPGAEGTLNGKTIDEKDLTLSITYKVKELLEANGFETSMTRTGDTLPSLSERPAQANAEGCALFVSIHINSAESTEASGTEVYWSQENVDKTDEAGIYKKDGEDFAQYVLDGMLEYMGSVDRGVRMANWAVTRRSNMPAILAEVGFISNTAELKKMCSDDYQTKTAKGIAVGIVKMLHSM